jgi:hypothetical protein
MVWNVNGNLALKIREPTFLSFISRCDVVFLLETWLRPSQEDTLPLPRGFRFLAQSRPDNNLYGRQWGGVGVLIRDDVPHSLVLGVSAPDILVLDLGFCFIVGAYLPPVDSQWHTWSDVDPEQRLQEAMAYCTAARDRMVLVLGDLNARTASRNSSCQSSPRSSADPIINARGHRLLRWCDMFQLAILNGTGAEGESPGALTCFQEQGASVVDYALVSREHASWIHDRALAVELSHWSDHASIAITLT